MRGSLGTGKCTVTSSISGACLNQSACPMSESTALRACFEPSTAMRIFMTCLLGFSCRSNDAPAARLRLDVDQSVRNMPGHTAPMNATHTDRTRHLTIEQRKTLRAALERLIE